MCYNLAYYSHTKIFWIGLVMFPFGFVWNVLPSLTWIVSIYLKATRYCLQFNQLLGSPVMDLQNLVGLMLDFKQMSRYCFYFFCFSGSLN